MGALSAHFPLVYLIVSSPSCLLHHDAVLALLWLPRLLTLLNLRNHALESLVHVLVVSGAGFRPAALEFFSQLTAVLGLDLALFWSQIRLVANNEEGYCLGALLKYFVSGCFCKYLDFEDPLSG